MTAPQPPRLEARLRSVQALRDAMDFAGLTIRGLAVACGNPKHRSTIGNLHAGVRDRCSVHLAGRIERVLRLPPYNLFDLRVVPTSNVVSSDRKIRSAA